LKRAFGAAFRAKSPLLNIVVRNGEQNPGKSSGKI
jgi:hypothetical protein